MGTAVRWSWRESGKEWKVEEWVYNPSMKHLHNSSAPLRIGALTKNGMPDHFWTGAVAGIVMKAFQGPDHTSQPAE